MRIVEHEIKRYVVRVKEYKLKAQEMQNVQGSPQYEEMAEYMRKEEKKLAIMVKK